MVIGRAFKSTELARADNMLRASPAIVRRAGQRSGRD